MGSIITSICFGAITNILTCGITSNGGFFLLGHYSGVIVRFIIGSQKLLVASLSALEEESAVYKDIVLLTDLQETYSSLSTKLLYTIKWVNEHFPNAQFMAKVCVLCLFLFYFWCYYRYFSSLRWFRKSVFLLSLCQHL